MTALPAEWRSVPAHVRWPDPELRRRYDAGEVVLDDGDEVIRSDTVADDVIDGIETGGR
jgi:hypothetical protein